MGHLTQCVPLREQTGGFGKAQAIPHAWPRLLTLIRLVRGSSLTGYFLGVVASQYSGVIFTIETVQSPHVGRRAQSFLIFSLCLCGEDDRWMKCLPLLIEKMLGRAEKAWGLTQAFS